MQGYCLLFLMSSYTVFIWYDPIRNQIKLSEWTVAVCCQPIPHSSSDHMWAYTNTARSIESGGYCGGRWFTSDWPPKLFSVSPFSALYEQYLIIITALLCGHKWSQKVFLIYSNNFNAINIINRGCSHTLDQPIKNSVVDNLFHYSFQEFKSLAPDSLLIQTWIPLFSASIRTWSPSCST